MIKLRVRVYAMDENTLLIVLSDQYHSETESEIVVSRVNVQERKQQSYLERIIRPQVNTIDESQVSSHLCFEKCGIFSSVPNKIFVIGVGEEAIREFDDLFFDDAEHFLISPEERA